MDDNWQRDERSPWIRLLTRLEGFANSNPMGLNSWGARVGGTPWLAVVPLTAVLHLGFRAQHRIRARNTDRALIEMGDPELDGAIVVSAVECGSRTRDRGRTARLEVARSCHV